MSIRQYLRVVWARKWLVLLLFAVTAGVGSAVVLNMPRSFAAEAALVVDVRPDPILGIAGPAEIATEVEILKSDKVATRAVQILGMDKNPEAREAWLKATDGKQVPLERYYASMLQRGMSAQPVRLSSVIAVTFYAADSAFAAAAANAFGQAAIDVSAEMKAEPAKQDVLRYTEQAKELRASLEAAQGRLTKYQQDKGIVITDGQMDQENLRLNALSNDLTTAQAEAAGASSRREGGGPESSGAQVVRGQISAQEAILSGNAGVWGPAHPERLATEAKIAALKRQLNMELGRGGGEAVAAAAAAAKKVSILKANLEEQKKKVLSLRFERDQASVLLKDVETAQRAYEEAGKRISEATVRSGTTQGSIRFLTRAVEPFARSNKQMVVGLLASIVGGLILGVGVAVGLELLDRRVRGADDMTFMYGVPVIGVMHPEGSRQPTFRQFSLGPNQEPPHKPNVPLLGAR